MSWEGSTRPAARLGVLALLVLAGLGFFGWQSASVLRHKRQPRPGLPPPQSFIVRIADVDEDALLAQVVHSGSVDEDALVRIEAQGEPKLTAAAYVIATRSEHERHRDDRALDYLQHALRAQPENAGLHAWRAMLLLDSGERADALAETEQASRLQPESADVQRISGHVYYRAGRLSDAIASWEHSLRLQPNASISEYLEKARREASVEQKFTESARGHFVLRYEGGQPAEALNDELWRALERAYDDLSADLEFSPKSAIIVIFYSRQQFSDVTQAPAWTGAVNDGKLRIPIGELTGMTPQLNSVLRHELTHSFVHEVAPRCPAWLNEGLAEMEEPSRVANLNPKMRLFAVKGFVPLEQLENTFQKMETEDAERAYVESLAAVEYLRSLEGMTGLRRLLRRIAEEQQTAVALQTISEGGYAELNEKTHGYLESGATQRH